MELTPKHNITESICTTFGKQTKILFTKNENYFVEDCIYLDGVLNYIVSDNQNARNYISINGEFINNFLIG